MTLRGGHLLPIGDRRAYQQTLRLYNASIQKTHQQIQRIVSYHIGIIRITSNPRVLDQICHPCLHFGVTAFVYIPETNHVDFAIASIFWSKMLRKHILSITKRWYINYRQKCPATWGVCWKVKITNKSISTLPTTLRHWISAVSTCREYFLFKRLQCMVNYYEIVTRHNTWCEHTYTSISYEFGVISQIQRYYHQLW
jgi:hypothetical protein